MAAVRPIARKDDGRNIYTKCTDCFKEYRYSKSNDHRCKIGRSHKKAEIGNCHKKSEIGRCHKKEEVGERCSETKKVGICHKKEKVGESHSELPMSGAQIQAEFDRWARSTDEELVDAYINGEGGGFLEFIKYRYEKRAARAKSEADAN